VVEAALEERWLGRLVLLAVELDPAEAESPELAGEHLTGPRHGPPVQLGQAPVEADPGNAEGIECRR
jgi:hypothetical protein